MRYVVLFLCCTLLLSFQTNAQHQYTEVSSTFLGEDRQIKIQLPRSYETEDNKEYPLILVMDADYLFEPIGGIVDYLSYWDEIPEAIVVGVMQKGNRAQDFQISAEEYLPFQSGEAFFDFIELELISYIENNYRTSPFRVIAGHGDSGNFANFFLLKQDPLFQAYINFSSYFTPLMVSRIVNALEKTQKKTWFYHAYSKNEIKQQLNEMKLLSSEAESIQNPQLHFITNEFENATHFTSVSQGVADAFEHIFSDYKPITPMEYEANLKDSSTPVDYLVDKYFTISDAYNIQINMRINDIMFTSKAIEKSKNWDEYKDLAKLARKNQPETLLESYFLARYFQEKGNPKRAMKHYQEAYDFEAVGQLTPELMLMRAEEIKNVFGY